MTKNIPQKAFAIILFCIGLFPASVQAALLQNPLAENPEEFVAPSELVGRIVQGVLSITGTVALAMVIYGGIQIVLGLNSGNESRFAGGKKTLLFAVLGLIISLAGYLVIDFLLATLQSAI